MCVCVPLQDVFITKARPANTLLDLIQRTKGAVRELDNLQYRRMKKILMGDPESGECYGSDTNGPSSDTTEVSKPKGYSVQDCCQVLE